MARRKKNYRRKSITHPSLTSVAGALIIAKRLNEGASPDSTVTGALASGNLNSALTRLMVYAPDLVTSTAGQSALVKGIGVATVGGFIRKALPNVKLGIGKFYARI